MKRTCIAATLLIVISAPAFGADPSASAKSNTADAGARAAAATASCEKLKGTEKAACLREAKQAERGSAQSGTSDSGPRTSPPAK